MRLRPLMSLFACLLSPLLAQAETAIGVPAYWGLDGDYDTIPDGALAVINPGNGVVDTSTGQMEIVWSARNYGEIISELQARGVHVQGYVPTGYFNHECDVMGECQTWQRIVTQIYAYYELYPELDGIFFDEAAASNKDCDDYAEEYAILRGLVRRYSETGSITFNPGMSDPCPVAAAAPDETVLTFEGNPEKFEEYRELLVEASRIAAQNNVKIWHLIYSVPDEEAVAAISMQSVELGADYFYATQIGGDWRAGDNTWGEPAKHWSFQADLFRE